MINGYCSVSDNLQHIAQCRLISNASAGGGKHTYLGSFDTAKKAAWKRDTEVFKLRGWAKVNGSFKGYNFPQQLKEEEAAGNIESPASSSSAAASAPYSTTGGVSNRRPGGIAAAGAAASSPASASTAVPRRHGGHEILLEDIEDDDDDVAVVGGEGALPAVAAGRGAVGGDALAAGSAPALAAAQGGSDNASTTSTSAGLACATGHGKPDTSADDVSVVRSAESHIWWAAGAGSYVYALATDDIETPPAAVHGDDGLPAAAAAASASAPHGSGSGAGNKRKRPREAEAEARIDDDAYDAGAGGIGSHVHRRQRRARKGGSDDSAAVAVMEANPSAAATRMLTEHADMTSAGDANGAGLIITGASLAQAPTAASAAEAGVIAVTAVATPGSGFNDAYIRLLSLAARYNGGSGAVSSGAVCADDSDGAHTSVERELKRPRSISRSLSASTSRSDIKGRSINSGASDCIAILRIIEHRIGGASESSNSSCSGGGSIEDDEEAEEGSNWQFLAQLQDGRSQWLPFAAFIINGRASQPMRSYLATIGRLDLLWGGGYL